jgi:transposase, IS30 family
MPGAPLSLPEREEISFALIENRDSPWAVIGRRVDRHPTTISREVDANGGRGHYRPALAERRSERCLRRPKTPVLARPGPVRDRVTAELKTGRSPEAIWADLDAEDTAGRVCVETIYTSVYAGVLDVTARECLRMRRPRRRSRQARHAHQRPALPNIGARPAAVDDRSEPGHWEADHIIGRANQSALMCLTERVSRFSLLITMPNGYTAADALAGLVEGLEQIPAHLRRSITFDQGSEWAQWPTLVASYGLETWFCDPHSPWQRGQIENLNRQWRWWFPRGTDLAGIDPAHADHVASIINGQRRRSLDHQSPTALYAALTVR